jgi:hypothetical protein
VDALSQRMLAISLDRSYGFSVSVSGFALFTKGWIEVVPSLEGKKDIGVSCIVQANKARRDMWDGI